MSRRGMTVTQAYGTDGHMNVMYLLCAGIVLVASNDHRDIQGHAAVVCLHAVVRIHSHH